MDSFLDEVHKEKVNNKIRQRRREKKLSKAFFNQDQESDTRLTVDNYAFFSEKISEISNSVTEISAESPYQNSYKKKDVVRLKID